MTQSNTKVPVAVRKRAQTQFHKVQNTIRMLQEVTQERLESAYARVIETTGPDGFGADSMPDSSIASGRMSDPTGAAVVARAAELNDPVRANVIEMSEGINSALRGAGAIVRNLDGLERLAKERQGRQVSLEECQACGAPTGVLRSGYCNPCRMAWQRAGFPDRVWFAATRPKWSPKVDPEPDGTVQ